MRASARSLRFARLPLAVIVAASVAPLGSNTYANLHALVGSLIFSGALDRTHAPLKHCGQRGVVRRHAVVKGPAPRLPQGSHKPLQSMGQSYLQDPNTIAKIVSAFTEAVNVRADAEAGSGNSKRVVEVGPGLGAVTRPLCQQFPGMTAVELDNRAVEILQRDVPKLDLIHQDVLQVDFSHLAAKLGGRIFLIGMLPYSIITDIFLHIAQAAPAIRYGLFMMQKEVGDRIVATPGTAAYGLLSVALQLFTKPKRLFTVPNTAFYPKPKVASCIVQLDFHEISPLPVGVQPSQFIEVVRTAFSQRRKRLRHSLKPLLERFRCAVPKRLDGLSADKLSPDDYVELTQHIFQR